MVGDSKREFSPLNPLNDLKEPSQKREIPGKIMRSSISITPEMKDIPEINIEEMLKDRLAREISRGIVSDPENYSIVSEFNNPFSKTITMRVNILPLNSRSIISKDKIGIEYKGKVEFFNEKEIEEAVINYYKHKFI